MKIKLLLLLRCIQQVTYSAREASMVMMSCNEKRHGDGVGGVNGASEFLATYYCSDRARPHLTSNASCHEKALGGAFQLPFVCASLTLQPPPSVPQVEEEGCIIVVYVCVWIREEREKESKEEEEEEREGTVRVMSHMSTSFHHSKNDKNLSC